MEFIRHDKITLEQNSSCKARGILIQPHLEPGKDSKRQMEVVA
jgi:hypothetical protein